ncbi:MAG TPA: Hsp20/alpha crystallin family protein [Pyrinomonadaceae bacterium]|nr:Hsp20/alpha crystallin family protein [Pyrinomonadaceae bacterium]
MPHWDPLRDLMQLQDRMNQLFEDATQRRARERQRDEIEHADWVPVADVYEQPTEYLVVLDLPGIDRDALEIDLENERLMIKGTRVTSNGERAVHRTERPQGKFNRSFGLPPAIDPEKIQAEYKDGVLSVHLPKREEQKPQAVKIKVS